MVICFYIVYLRKETSMQVWMDGELKELYTTGKSNKGLSLINGISSAYPVHPGTILGEELRARGIRQKDFAEQIGMQASHLSAVITGSRNITSAIAKKIAIGLSDIPEQIWIALQEKYTANMRKMKANPSLLVSGYIDKADYVQPAFAEPGVEYGTKLHYKLSIPIRDEAILASLSSRLGWSIEETE